jgi:hypothetical protein
MGAQDQGSRDKKRAANTARVMENRATDPMAMRTGQRVDMYSDATVQKVSNYGRGLNFAKDGRIISNQPTFGEFVGDTKRMLVGGTAKTPSFSKRDPKNIQSETSNQQANINTYAATAPTPKKTEGIIPKLINTGGMVGFVSTLLGGGSKDKKGKLLK